MKLTKRQFEIEYKLEKSDEGTYVTGLANTKNKEDRVGDIPYSLDGKPVYNLKEFKKNPVALIDHRNSVENIIGSFVNIKETDKGLEFKLKIMDNPMTDIAKHAKEALIGGYVRTFSIGYSNPVYGDPKNSKRLTSLDLHEISVVAIPADPNALSDTPIPKKLEGEDLENNENSDTIDQEEIKDEIKDEIVGEPKKSNPKEADLAEAIKQLRFYS